MFMGLVELQHIKVWRAAQDISWLGIQVHTYKLGEGDPAED